MSEVITLMVCNFPGFFSNSGEDNREAESQEKAPLRGKGDPQNRNEHLISLFTGVAVDVSHRMYITLGLWGDERWDFRIQLEFIRESWVSAEIEVAFCYVNVNSVWQVFPWLQGNYSLTKLQHILISASLLRRELAYITAPRAIKSGHRENTSENWSLRVKTLKGKVLHGTPRRSLKAGIRWSEISCSSGGLLADTA